MVKIKGSIESVAHKSEPTEVPGEPYYCYEVVIKMPCYRTPKKEANKLHMGDATIVQNEEG